MILILQNPAFPYDSYLPFDLEELDESERGGISLSKARYTSSVQCFTNSCSQHSICDGIEGLWMMLRLPVMVKRHADMVI